MSDLFQICVKNIFECKFIHLYIQVYTWGLQDFFLIGPRIILYCSVVCVRENYHDGEDDADGCNAEY